jgi:two-component system LytT family response regulator
MIRALIVDDEPLAREAIREMVRADGAFTIVGECEDGEHAVLAIRRLRPDVVFLDVQMQGLDGFGVIEAVGVDRMPAVVFATAYDQYALRAFDAQAIDYVLKPFDDERFRRTLARIRSVKAGTQPFGNLLQQVRPGSQERLAVKSGGRTLFLRHSEIRWIEARANYVAIHTARDVIIVRETCKSIEARLHGPGFVRIHRSAIVNTANIREIRPWYTGEYVIVLEDGRELTMSRGYRTNLPRLRSVG